MNRHQKAPEDLGTRPCPSPLLIGSGIIRKTKCSERLELRLNFNDLEHITTHNETHVFYVEHDEDSVVATVKPERSPRAQVTTLPKTYATRSGSLLLFSENKIADEKNLRKENGRPSKDMAVHGHPMKLRPVIEESYPYWGRLVNNDRSRTNISQDRQIPGVHTVSPCLSACSNSSRVTMKPNERIQSSRDDIHTVNNLSEAVLSYTARPQSHQERYLCSIRNTWSDWSDTKLQEVMIPNKLNISPWTRAWIKNQNSVIMQEPRRSIKKKETPRPYHQSWIPQTQTHFTCSRNERVPVNSPASGLKRLSGTFDQTLNRQMSSRGTTGKYNSKQGQFGFRV